MSLAVRRRAGFVLFSLLVALAHPAAAQVEAAPQLTGTVVRSGAPLPDAEVVLHRVDAEVAGVLDTTLTSAAGTFLFDLPTVPDPGGRGEIYFASVEHEGVLYFGSPVGTAAELDSVYRIEVHDTLAVGPGGADIPVEVRYLLVEEVPEGWSVTDLIQLRVDGDRTLVPPEGGVTWRYRIPADGRDVQVGGGDIAPVSTTFSADTVGVIMPLSPGMRQIVLRYRLDSLDLQLPLPGLTEELEVLVRQPTPQLFATGLVEVEPVEMEPGVTYRRFAAAQMTDSSVSLAGVPTPTSWFRVEWLMVVLGLVLAVAGIWAVQRRPAGVGASPASGPAPGPESGPAPGPESGPPPTTPATSRSGPSSAPVSRDERDRILLRIARLDERLEQADADADRAALQREREELTRRLAAAPR